jgi:hypothetical protein
MSFILPYTKLDPVRNFLEVKIDSTYTYGATETSVILINDAFISELNDKILTYGNVNLVWYNWTKYKSPQLDPNREIIRTRGVMSGTTLPIQRPGSTNNPVVTGIGQYLDEGDTNTAKLHNVSGDEYRLMLAFTKRSYDIIDTGLYMTGYTGFTGTSGYTGYTGFIGYTGYSGYTGYTGFTGYTGYSGYTGPKGFTGYTGFSGYTGYTGSIGQTGYTGYTGYSGYTGYTGLIGQTGFTGYSGYTGYTGYIGSIGQTGYTGFSGYTGYTGYTGSIGQTGYTGLTGFTGYTGYTGLVGQTGYTGYTGFIGYTGYTGYTGAGAFTGYTGFSGYTGYTGANITGYTGYTGYTGIAGSATSTGATGYTGLGLTGYTGYTGAGLTGYTGYSGFTGYTGTAGTTGYTGYTGLGITGYTGYTGAGNFTGYTGYTGFTGYTGSSFWSAGTSGSIYYNAGNVGIGTTGPSQPLTVNGNTLLTSGAIGVGSAAAAQLGSYDFVGATQGSIALMSGGIIVGQFAASSQDIYFDQRGNTAGHIYFRTSGNNTRMTMDANTGNVGIGTDAPGVPLDVNGKIYSRTGGIYSDAWSSYLGGGTAMIITGPSAANINMNINPGYAFTVGGGNVGIGTTSPTNILSLGGNSARTFWMERHTTANTSGNNLVVQSGGATVAATDKDSGILYEAPGISTGMGKSSIRIQGLTRAASTATSDNTLQDRVIIPSEKNLVNNTATSLFEIALPTLSMASGRILYQIDSTDGTDMQTHSGNISYSAVNKGGVYTEQISDDSGAGDSKAVSSGTLVDTWTILDGTNKITIQLKANSSLTPTILRVRYTLFSGSNGLVTQL